MNTKQIALWLKEDKNRILLLALVIGSLLTIFIASLFTMAGKEEQLLTENFFRFHVLANSDSEEDQVLKLKVRDAVIDYLEPGLRESNSKEATRAYILTHLPEITDVAGRTLRAAGSSYELQVVVGESEFPTKSYGSVTLPAGRYESLCIQIGEAEGRNWWCVMFPTLCFVEETEPEAMEEDLAEHLPQEQNELIHQPRSFKFKLVEWYHKLFG